MENKYYTPTIEEFHVGFEYEELSGTDSEGGEDWSTREIIHSFGAFDEDIDALEDGFIRVKYLDKQDIEELGFKRLNSKILDNILDEYRIPYNDSTNEIISLIIREGRVVISYGYKETPLDKFKTWFAGYIKNKSELKRVLKMLDINA